MSLEVKYPHVTVRLSGEDGHALLIVGRVKAALRRAGVSEEEVEAFKTEALSGDYDHVLQTVIKTVDVDGDDEEEEW